MTKTATFSFSDMWIRQYALVLKGTMDIQGLVAIEKRDDAKAVHIHWACTAPHNNIWENLKHYQDELGAEPFPYGAPPHPYRFIINEANMKRITEEYQYEDADEEI